MGSTRTDYIAGLQTPALLGNQKVKVEHLISLADNNSVASDVIQCLKIPAGAFVDRVGVLVITAEDSTLTATVGDDSGAAGWDAAVNLESTGMTFNDLDSGTDSYGEGKYYSSADTIDLTMSADIGDTAVFMVWASMFIMEQTT